MEIPFLIWHFASFAAVGVGYNALVTHVVVHVAEIKDFGRFRVGNGEDDGIHLFIPNFNRVLELLFVVLHFKQRITAVVQWVLSVLGFVTPGCSSRGRNDPRIYLCALAWLPPVPP